MITWLLVGCTIVGIYLYLRWKGQYWARRNVPIASGALTGLGHVHKLFSQKKRQWELRDTWYREDGGSTFCGLYNFTYPAILVGDPDLIKAICIKDFDHFVDRRNFNFEHKKDESSKEMLTNLSGNHWKSTRAVLSTSFSSGRIKGVYPLVLKKADDLVEYLQKHRQEEPVQKMKKAFGLFTMEVIASCAFGLETNSFGDENSTFTKKANGFFNFGFKQVLKFLLIFSIPKFNKLFRLSNENMDFFEQVVEETMKQRDINGPRGDFLDIMRNAKEEVNSATKKSKYPFSDMTITASMVLFLIAGYDTTANTISFAVHLLAHNPEAQQRLRDEIKELVAEHGSFTYQAIMEAKYLDACLSETLRLFPPAHIMERKCTKDYVIPGTDVLLPKDMMVAIPAWSLHYDERYWHEPKKFNPERFMPGNKENIVSGTYMPFGLGPRNCIAMRFAQLEAKTALARVVQEFQLDPVAGTEEIELDKNIFIMRLKDDGPLTLTPLIEE